MTQIKTLIRVSVMYIKYQGEKKNKGKGKMRIDIYIIFLYLVGKQIRWLLSKPNQSELELSLSHSFAALVYVNKRVLWLRCNIHWDLMMMAMYNVQGGTNNTKVKVEEGWIMHKQTTAWPHAYHTLFIDTSKAIIISRPFNTPKIYSSSYYY